MTALAKMLAVFDTAANFTSSNPTLRVGEMGVETDTGRLKIGTGSTVWTSLAYVKVAAGDVTGILTVPNGGTGASTLTGYVKGNGASAMTASATIPIADVADIASGTYTPTLTGVLNVAASTAYVAQYMRVGTVVTVSGRIDVDPTAASGTTIGVTLPVASNFGSVVQLAGAGTFNSANAVACYADATNDRAELQWNAGVTTNSALYFTFTYRII